MGHSKVGMLWKQYWDTAFIHICLYLGHSTVFRLLRTLHLEKFAYILQSSSWRFLFIFVCRVEVGLYVVYLTELLSLDTQQLKCCHYRLYSKKPCTFLTLAQSQFSLNPLTVEILCFAKNKACCKLGGNSNTGGFKVFAQEFVNYQPIALRTLQNGLLIELMYMLGFTYLYCIIHLQLLTLKQ